MGRLFNDHYPSLFQTMEICFKTPQFQLELINYCERLQMVFDEISQNPDDESAYVILSMRFPIDFFRDISDSLFGCDFALMVEDFIEELWILIGLIDDPKLHRGKDWAQRWMQTQYDRKYRELIRSVMMITPGVFRKLDQDESHESAYGGDCEQQ